MSKVNNIIHNVLGGGGYIVNGRTGEAMTSEDLQALVEATENRIGRKKVFYKQFVRMTLNEHFTTLEDQLTNAEYRFLSMICKTAGGDNRCNFGGFDIGIHYNTLTTFRAKLRRIGFIDRVKLGAVPDWYLNPYYSSRAKTLPVELYEHFDTRFPSMIEAVKQAEKISS